ncbi:hypothetical protein GQ42DRAFT_164724 [Ramicandelaber brevisporus]|nr:hypothetical protein GQ42DRAFT_164724 [Ramicandelaber brevisporus]
MSISLLPIELADLLLTFCDVRSLLSLRAVNRAYYKAVSTALARIVDTAGRLNPDEPTDCGLPSGLLRSLLSSHSAEHVRGLVVREIMRKVGDMSDFRHKENAASGFEEADEFLLQHRRLSLISHPDNIVGKASRQIDAYRPQSSAVQHWLQPAILDDLPHLTKLCILNHNPTWMPRNLQPRVLARLTWLEVEVDGMLVSVVEQDLDNIATHCQQLTHLRIVSAAIGLPKEAWLKFVNRLTPSKFRVLDLIVYPHLNTDVWIAIYNTQRKSLRAAVLYQAPHFLEYLATLCGEADDWAPFRNVTHLLTVSLDDNSAIDNVGIWFPNVKCIQVTNPDGEETRILGNLPQVDSYLHRGRFASYRDTWHMSGEDNACLISLSHLTVVHLIWEPGISAESLVALFSLPLIQKLSITECYGQQVAAQDPSKEIEDAMFELWCYGMYPGAPSLRVLRLLFWRQPISLEALRSVLDSFPRLGSLQLAAGYTPSATIEELRREFGARRVGTETMDFGELEPKHGVLAEHSYAYFEQAGIPRWSGSEDDPEIVITDEDYYKSHTPYYGEPRWVRS